MVSGTSGSEPVFRRKRGVDLAGAAPRVARRASGQHVVEIVTQAVRVRVTVLAGLGEGPGQHLVHSSRQPGNEDRRGFGNSRVRSEQKLLV